MGPRKSYLAPTESSQTVRGTDFQRQRARVSIVLYVNGDGLHNVPVQYMGTVLIKDVSAIGSVFSNMPIV